jgi:hypothetical protein
MSVLAGIMKGQSLKVQRFAKNSENWIKNEQQGAQELLLFSSYCFQFKGILNWHDVIGINMLQKGSEISESVCENRKLHMRKRERRYMSQFSSAFKFDSIKFCFDFLLEMWLWCKMLKEKMYKNNNDGLFLWYSEAKLHISPPNVGCAERESKTKFLDSTEQKIKTF